MLAYMTLSLGVFMRLTHMCKWLILRITITGIVMCLIIHLLYTDPSGEKLKWWQWALMGLGVDSMLGGAISISATTTYFSAVATIGMGAGTAQSIDFAVTYFGTLFNGDPAWDEIIDDVREIIPHLAALCVVWDIVRKLRSYLACIRLFII